MQAPNGCATKCTRNKRVDFAVPNWLEGLPWVHMQDVHRHVLLQAFFANE